MWIPSLSDLLSYIPVVPEFTRPTPYACQEDPETGGQACEGVCVQEPFPVLWVDVERAVEDAAF